VSTADRQDQPFNSFNLPHQCLDDKWDSLVFEEPIRETTLRALMRAISERNDTTLKHVLPDWQNNVILHGPQGFVRIRADTTFWKTLTSVQYVTTTIMEFFACCAPKTLQ